jgi:hypothetical protein
MVPPSRTETGRSPVDDQITVHLPPLVDARVGGLLRRPGWRVDALVSLSPTCHELFPSNCPHWTDLVAPGRRTWRRSSSGG